MLGNTDLSWAVTSQQQFYTGGEYKMWRTEASILCLLSQFSLLFIGDCTFYMANTSVSVSANESSQTTVFNQHWQGESFSTLWHQNCCVTSQSCWEPIIITTQYFLCIRHHSECFTFMRSLQTIYDVGAINYAHFIDDDLSKVKGE